MGSSVRRVASVTVGIACLLFLPLLHSVPVAAGTLTVTNCNDSGGGSLRGQITAAVNGDTIGFTPGLNCSGGSTILLTSTLTLTKSVVIDGTGATIVVDGQSNGPVFTVNSSVTATLNGLTIQHGSGFPAPHCALIPCGGGIYNQGALSVTNSTVAANNASIAGGGIFNNGTVTVTNSTLANNSASIPGGGIYNNSGTLFVTNSTFSANAAGGGGGGIGAINNGTVALTNTIVANSPSGSNCVADSGGTITADSHNLADDATCGSAHQVTSAQINLQALGNNGGPTQTFALRSGSAAVGLGDPTACANTGGTAPVAGKDQRGLPRPTTACASGSFEPQPFAIAASVGSPQSTPIGTAFATNLGATVTDNETNPLPGYSVTFTAPSTPTAATGSFATSPVVTSGSTGVATAPIFTANSHLGAYSVTANLTTNAFAIPASFSLTNLPGPAATFTVTGYPASVVAGTSHPVTVTAFDQFGNIATGYTGTVAFTSTDTLATLPANYPFVAGDAGVHSFNAPFGSAGTFTLTATDTTTNTITGTQAGLVVTPVSTTTTLDISPSPAAHGAPVMLTATIAPATTTTLPTPTGTVTFSEGGTPLTTVTLVNGVATFMTNTLTVGLHHLTATYTPAAPGPYTTSQVTGDETITTAAGLVSIAVTPARGTLKLGQVQQYTATGTYADNTTADLTSAVTWSSDAPSVASVDASGKGAGVSPGSAHLTATQGSVSGQTTVTVTPPTPVGIAPAAAPASRPSGTTSEPGSGTPAPNPAPTGR